MRNKFNLSGISIGVAALVVGLAGNVQAIPTTTRDYNASQSARSLDWSGQNQSLASLQTLRSTKVVKAKKVAGSRKAGGKNLIRPILVGLTPLSPVANQGVLPTGGLAAGTPLPLPVTVLTQPLSSGSSGTTAQVDSATSAPDGGTTATLLGGTFCGLALLRKKLKA